MRVLSVLHFPVFGGPHNRNARVAKELKRLEVETIIVLPEEASAAAERIRSFGAEVVQIPLSRLRPKHKTFSGYVALITNTFRDIVNLRRLMIEHRVDVVLVNGLVSPHAAIAGRLSGKRVVWQILDSFPPMWLRRWAMLVVRLLSDAIMCTGAKVAEEHPGATANPNRLVLFYPPVDVTVFSPRMEERLAAREALGLAPDELVVGNVSNLNPMKGHITFIRAAALLRKSLNNVRFVILGATYENHTEYTKEFYAEVERLGLKLDRDIFIRNPGKEVARLAQAFDLFWMTSEPRSEGISTAVEEAMSLALPVVTTDVGSMSEIVRDGKTGFVVAPHDVDAIVEKSIVLLSDGSLRMRMGQAARHFAELHFPVSVCAEAHLSAFNIALGQAANKRAEEVERLD